MRIRLEKQYIKPAAGIIIALACLLGFWYVEGPMNIAWGLAAGALAAGFLRLELENKVVLSILYTVLFLVLPLLTFDIGWTMQDVTDYHMTNEKVLLNAGIYLAIQLVLLTVFSNIRLSMIVTHVAVLFLILINIYVVMFRGNMLSPYDLLAAKTAANVAGEYDFTPTPEMMHAFVMVALTILTLFCFPKLKVPRTKITMGLGIGLSALCMSILVNQCGTMRAKYWNNQGATHNGYVLNFILQIRDGIITAPDGYTTGEVESLEEAYPRQETAASNPDIIVIMSEAFADLRNFPQSLNTNVELTPFIDSLKENTTRGFAYASVFGGRTANSEWEYLTGNTMAFLPQGTVPYQQYMSGQPYSLVTVLQDRGYDCIAMHPYYPNGWRRDTVYPMMDFDRFIALGAFPQEQMSRVYVSDQEMFEQIVQYHQQQDENIPLFLFGVTMQNHGGYTYEGENYEKTVELEGYSKEYPQAEQYLSLLRESDRAMQYLIEYYESIDRDVVIVFFGDHQPNVEETFYEELNEGSFDRLYQKMRKQQVPFFVWTNYDTPEQEVNLTSLNYLPVYTLEAAGIELPPYFQFLKELQADIPAITSFGYYSKSKEAFIDMADTSGAAEETDRIRQYRYLQYNNMFDDKNRSEHFFAAQLP